MKQSIMSAVRRAAPRVLVALSLTLAASLPFVGTAEPALAATRYHICRANDVYVRTEPLGPIVGLLHRGETFDLRRYSPSGQWAEGYAYGQVNAAGWVPTQYLC